MTAGQVKEISSLANPIIKDLRALAQKKNREREGLFITEGLKLVLEGLELGAKIRYFVYAEKDGQSALIEQAAARAYAGGALIIKANNKIMEAITHRDNAQNCIGVFEQRWFPLEQILKGKAPRAFGAETADDNAALPRTANAETQAAKSGRADISEKRNKLYLALDRVRDPGNLGTIIRTADAAGADGIILIGETVSPYALETARATMGSIFAVPLCRVSEEEFLAARKNFRGLAVGAHLKGAADYRKIPYFQKSKKDNAAGANNQENGDVLLLMGNEQKGLTDALAASCDALARIPQVGRADSLNLAVSTGIMLYEICRSRLSL